MLSPSQAARVAAGIEGEYRREEQREQRAMDSKTIPQFAHKQQFSPVFFTAFTRHQNAAAEFLEKLLEDHQVTDADEDTQAAMASVFTALQNIATANDSAKPSLDDFGQKWNDSPAQFELNRKFARSHNPDDDSIAAGPGIYDNYKRQVNAYGIDRSRHLRQLQASGQCLRRNKRLQARLTPARSQACRCDQDRLSRR